MAEARATPFQRPAPPAGAGRVASLISLYSKAEASSSSRAPPRKTSHNNINLGYAPSAGGGASYVKPPPTPTPPSASAGKKKKSSSSRTAANSAKPAGARSPPKPPSAPAPPRSASGSSLAANPDSAPGAPVMAAKKSSSSPRSARRSSRKTASTHSFTPYIPLATSTRSFGGTWGRTQSMSSINAAGGTYVSPSTTNVSIAPKSPRAPAAPSTSSASKGSGKKAMAVVNIQGGHKKRLSYSSRGQSAKDIPMRPTPEVVKATVYQARPINLSAKERTRSSSTQFSATKPLPARRTSAQSSSSQSSVSSPSSSEPDSGKMYGIPIVRKTPPPPASEDDIPDQKPSPVVAAPPPPVTVASVAVQTAKAASSPRPPPPRPPKVSTINQTSAAPATVTAIMAASASRRGSHHSSGSAKKRSIKPPVSPAPPQAVIAKTQPDLAVLAKEDDMRSDDSGASVPDIISPAEALVEPDPNDRSVEGLQAHASFAFMRGAYQKSHGWYTQLVEATKSGDKLTHAEALANLGRLDQWLGDFPAARTHMEESLKIRVEALGNADHPDVLRSRVNLAGLYTAMGLYDPARKELQETLTRYERVGETMKSLEYASNLLQLGRLSVSKGDYDDAEHYLTRALDISRGLLDPTSDPNYAAQLSELGDVYHALGNYCAAEACHQQAVNIYKASGQGGRPDHASALNNLAMVYESRGKLAEAESTLSEARRILEHVLVFEAESEKGSKPAIDIAAKLTSEKITDSEKAELMEKLATPSYSAVLSNLAQLYHSQEKHEEALTLYKLELEIAKIIYGDRKGAAIPPLPGYEYPVHPEVAKSLNNLATLYMDMGMLDDAETALTSDIHIGLHVFSHKADESCSELHGAHPEVTTSLNNMAVAHSYSRNTSAAEDLLEETLRVTRETFGDDHPYTVEALENLALFHNKMGAGDAASPLLKEARKIQKRLTRNSRVASGHVPLEASLGTLGAGKGLSIKIQNAKDGGDMASSGSRFSVGSAASRGTSAGVSKGSDTETLDTFLSDVSDPYTRPCIVCRKPMASKVCARCMRVPYCSKECQTIHWPRHMRYCRDPNR